MIYAFGEFEADEGLYQLRAQEEPVKLAPKVFDVLEKRMLETPIRPEEPRKGF
jgi:DNA-binding winged helix-turn-helix (wHTH) protein